MSVVRDVSAGELHICEPGLGTAPAPRPSGLSGQRGGKSRSDVAIMYSRVEPHAGCTAYRVLPRNRLAGRAGRRAPERKYGTQRPKR